TSQPRHTGNDLVSRERFGPGSHPLRARNNVITQKSLGYLIETEPDRPSPNAHRPRVLPESRQSTIEGLRGIESSECKRVRCQRALNIAHIQIKIRLTGDSAMNNAFQSQRRQRIIVTWKL